MCYNVCVCLSAIATASVVRLPGSDHQAKYMRKESAEYQVKRNIRNCLFLVTIPGMKSFGV